MNIIIVGCGKVGYTTAQNLMAEKGVNLTIIDNNPEAFEKASETLDVMLIRGNALSENTLIEAGAKDADLIISVTGADETNILCCICAKYIGAKRTIARVRDPEYASEFNKLWRNLGIDMTINPEYQTAREISRLLRFPAAADEVVTFIGGRVEMVTFNVSEAAEFFIGQSVSQVFRKNKREVLLSMVLRGDTAIIPNGALVFKENDIIGIMGRPSNVMDFLSYAWKKPEKTGEVTIIGGSKIARYLVELLNRHTSKAKIKIIEKDRKKCEQLSESYPRCLIINGDGTNEEIISDDEIKQSDAMICLTDRDEENIIISLYSIRNGVKRVISKVNYINRDIVKNLNIGSIVNPQNITSDRIIGYVRGISGALTSSIRTMNKVFDDGKAGIEAVEFIVSSGSKLVDIPLKDLNLKDEIIIGCIVRGEKITIPTGDSFIQTGDSVVIIAKTGSVKEFDDISS